MIRKNRLIFANNTVYGLSKDFGFRIDLYQPVEITDFKTGRKTVTRTKYPIKKAVILPNQLFRDYDYANILKAVGQFQFGGILDVSQRSVLVDKKYLPRNFRVTVNDYIIFNGDKYNLTNIAEFELADYWFFTIKQVSGEVRNEIFNHRMKDWVDFDDNVSLSST